MTSGKTGANLHALEIARSPIVPPEVLGSVSVVDKWGRDEAGRNRYLSYLSHVRLV